MSGGTQAVLIFVGVLIVVLLIVVSGKRDADDAGPVLVEAIDDPEGRVDDLA